MVFVVVLKVTQEFLVAGWSLNLILTAAIQESVIRESVDSLCKDGADVPIILYKQNPLKLQNAEILSLYRHLASISTQQDSQSTAKS